MHSSSSNPYRLPRTELPSYRPDLRRLAVRLGRRLAATGLTDELPLRVALETDKEGARLSVSDKSVVAELVRAHITGDFPLPTRGERYSQNEWLHVSYSLSTIPTVRSALALILTFEGRIGDLLGQDQFLALFKARSDHPRTRLLNGIESLAVCMRDEEPEYRTPDTLKAYLEKVERCCHNIVVFMNVASNPFLYDPAVDPQEKVNRYRHAEGQYFLKAVLEVVHGVPFQHIYRDLPDFWDLLYSRATVAELVDGFNRREVTYAESRREFLSRQQSKLRQVSELLDQLDTTHLATINRKLKPLGARMVRVASDAQHAVMLDMDDAGRFFGPSGNAEGAVERLLHVLEQRRFTP